MSLINDALKRVKAAQQQAAPTASVGPQLRPIEPQTPVRQGVNLLIPGALAAAALLGLLLVWVVRQKTQSDADTLVRAQVTSAAAPASADPSVPAPIQPAASAVRLPSGAPDTAAPAKAPVAEVTHRPATDSQKPLEATNSLTASVLPVVSGEPKTAATGAQAASANPEANTGSLSNAPAVAATSSNVLTTIEAPKPAPLKLQGIVYDRRRPSAVISGRTVFVGDRIRDMRVVAITAESATLVAPGRTNVLSLAE